MIHTSTDDNFLFGIFDNLFESPCSFFHFETPCQTVQFFFSMLLLSVAILFLIRNLLNPLFKSIFSREYLMVLKKRWLVGWALVTLFLGWFTYLIGFCAEGTSRSIFAIIFRPLISALELFVTHSDLLEISPQCHESPWFMGLFTFVYVSAILVSSTIAINCMLYRLSFRIRRCIWSLDCNAGRRLYVFFGINDKSVQLARSIREKESKEPQDTVPSRMIFVCFPGDIHETQTHNVFSKILGLSYDPDEMKAVKELSAIIINTHNKLYDDVHPSGLDPYVLESNGLDDLVPLLKKSLHIKLFFLSENESENIRSAINIDCSHTISREKQSVDIYCKARRSYENYAVTDQSKHSIFHLVDDSFFAVNSLKTMPYNEDSPNSYIAHPINYVKINSEYGTVESPFTCLIVGFGQTGRDALRFFYEFGSFVGNDGKKSPFLCHVVDRNMRNILGNFRSNLPYFTDLFCSNELNDDNKPQIRFSQCELSSCYFWRLMEKEKWIDKLNCIVVALGDDEQNIQVATQLYEYAVRHNAIGNKESESLKIFVRAYSPQFNERFEMVENYYKQENDVIRIFGRISDIYRYDTIIDDKFNDLAQKFYDQYCDVVNDHSMTWDERHKRLRSGTITQRYGFRHKENQDKSNVLHQYTKLRLLGVTSSNLPVRICPKELNFRLYSYPLNENMSQKCSYKSDTSDDDKWKVRLVNVSKCEHMRWVSSHIMLGYRYQDEKTKDFRRRIHKCLVDWDKLPDSTKQYDYAVVKTTLELL